MCIYWHVSLVSFAFAIDAYYCFDETMYICVCIIVPMGTIRYRFKMRLKYVYMKARKSCVSVYLLAFKFRICIWYILLFDETMYIRSTHSNNAAKVQHTTQLWVDDIKARNMYSWCPCEWCVEGSTCDSTMSGWYKGQEHVFVVPIRIMRLRFNMRLNYEWMIKARKCLIMLVAWCWPWRRHCFLVHGSTRGFVLELFAFSWLSN